MAEAGRTSTAAFCFTACLFATSLSFGVVRTLKCWHCIADNCHIDPSDNSRATMKDCKGSRFCQKVYYEMRSTSEKRIYSSTVRSCSADCQPQNDFRNCTPELFTTRGCVKKVCCNNKNLCNSAPPFPSSSWLWTPCVIFFVKFRTTF